MKMEKKIWLLVIELNILQITKGHSWWIKKRNLSTFSYPLRIFFAIIVNSIYCWLKQLLNQLDLEYISKSKCKFLVDWFNRQWVELNGYGNFYIYSRRELITATFKNEIVKKKNSDLANTTSFILLYFN